MFGKKIALDSPSGNPEDLEAARMKAITSAILALILLSVSSAQAAVLRFEGTFDASNFADFPSLSLVDGLSGSFQVFFDEGLVTGTGIESFDLYVTSATIAPNPIGSTAFGTNNLGVELVYSDGAFGMATFGGDISGFSGIDDNQDDLFVGYLSSGTVGEVGYSIAAETSIRMAGNVSGTLSVTAVPIPAAAWLFASALGAFG